jgi:hypothetical protein
MKILGTIAILAGLFATGCGYHDHYGRRGDIRRAHEEVRRAGWEARQDLRRARRDLQRELRESREEFRREMRDAHRDLREEFGRW